MRNVRMEGFDRDFEYDSAKKQQRKADRERRQARKGKRNVWTEKE